MKNLAELATTFAILAVLLNVFMALAVNGDAKRLVAGRGGLFLFGPFVWGWITFVFSIAGLALYWAIHHSALRSTIPPKDR